MAAKSGMAQINMPPASLPAEQALIGSMLVAPELLAKARRRVTEADFYGVHHRPIWRAMLDFHASGESIDTITLSEHLHDAGLLEVVGGRAYIRTLMETVPTAANWEQYAAIVIEKAERRRAIDDAHTRLQIVLDESIPLEAPARSGLRATELSDLSAPLDWPAAMEPEAFHGIAGRIVRMIAPETEADPIVLLTNFLVGFGNAIGRTAHAVVGRTRHHTNLFAVHVGPSGEGRKGTGLDAIMDVLYAVDPVWATERFNRSCLSSGEGLINAVRDATERQVAVKNARTKESTGEYETVVDDEGVQDKRLLAAQTELSGILKVMNREGNTLSPVMRQAWDSGDMGMLVKNAPGRVRGAHISIIGHITPQELLRSLTETEAANGFANRFLWLCCRRSQYLPEGGEIPALGPLTVELRYFLEHARSLTVIRRDDEAKRVWAAVYPILTRRHLGMLGAVTSRAEPQVLRLSTIYALLDGETTIRAPHLLAALAVWDYAQRSAAFIFGCSTGDHLSDKMLSLIAAEPEGLSTHELRGALGHNWPAAALQQALRTLLDAEMIRSESQPTRGRSREVWFARGEPFTSSGSRAVSPALIVAREVLNSHP